MRAYILPLSVCLLTVVLAFALSGCTQNGSSPVVDPRNGAAATTRVSTPTSSQVVTGTQDILLYPGARLTGSAFPSEEPGSGLFVLEIDAAVGKVVAFYNERMPQNGWVLAGSPRDGSVAPEEQRFLFYVWTNPTNAAPARRILRLIIDKTLQGGSYVTASFHRWPDPSKLPLPPEAQKVTVEWTNGGIHGRPAQRTTYVTTTTPSAVEAYYKAVMIAHGWGLASSSPYPGIAFSYEILGPASVRNVQWGSVTVAPQSLGNGQTKVEVEVSGSEVVH